MDDLLLKNELQCDVIQDLLPLYHDGVCSRQSQTIVEEHVKTCSVCKKMLEELDENMEEVQFTSDAKEVLQHHAKKEKTLAVKMGIIIAAILLVPILIAVLLTLPGYSDWATNAVLIASMLLIAGFTVVPLLSKKRKFTKTIVCSTIALLLVIFFVEMLFDKGGLFRFCEIAFSVIFGISLVFAPFVVRQTVSSGTWQNHKAFLTMLWDTICFYLMLVTFAVAYPDSARDILLVSSAFAAMAWVSLGVARYLKVNRFIKTGLLIFVFGIFTAISVQRGWMTIMDRDIHQEILIVSIVCGAIFCVIGIIAMIKAKRNETAS